MRRIMGGIAVFGAGAAALAGEGDIYRDQGLAGWDFFLREMIRSLDLVTFLLFIVLIVVLGMAADLFLHLRIERLIPESLLADVQENMSNGEYEKALETCQKSGSLVGQTFAAALSKTDYSFDRMREAMRGEAAIQGLVWRQWVSQFRNTAAAGFLLGFGGFVIEAMRFVSDLSGRPNISLALASSLEMRSLVYCAFLCLLLGVATAVVSLVVATIASSKLEKVLLESDRLGEELLDPFRPLPVVQEE